MYRLGASLRLERLFHGAFAVVARYDAEAHREFRRALPGQAWSPARLGLGRAKIAGRTQPCLVPGNKRLALRFDGLGFIGLQCI